MTRLERHFSDFRKNIIGINKNFLTPYGKKRIIYADWIASGRLYKPIEKKLLNEIGPYVSNTHTEANVTGSTMTAAYTYAQQKIKKHVNADLIDDVLITDGSGMTSVINKLQRILGLRVPERYKDRIFLKTENRPVIFVTHMEHHSNHTSWLETIAEVVVIEPGNNNEISLDNLRQTVKRYQNRKFKIGAFTACSNVTGIETPIHAMAKIMHENGGVCFIDFACSAPYVNINMRPANKLEHLDAIYFSPHKFLGGPGTSGVLIFNKSLYKNSAPDHSGGGTVNWTNPWGGISYYHEIERREDGGTPGFLQTIKTALCIRLKEEMGVRNIEDRESELVRIAFDELQKIKGVHILQGDVKKRLGVISFYIEGIHYNLITKMLSDRFGVQVRSGCVCAGTYGHYLFGVTKAQSKEITDKIEEGDLSLKPGWVRLSLHPTMTNAELLYIVKAIKLIVENIIEWEKDYYYDSLKNEFYHHQFQAGPKVSKWFEED